MTRDGGAGVTPPYGPPAVQGDVDSRLRGKDREVLGTWRVMA